MTNDNHAYFLQRAAEEMAAADHAICPIAASVHRELALRYSLRLVLPEPASASDDTRPFGVPKTVPQRRVTSPPRRRSPKRARA